MTVKKMVYLEPAQETILKRLAAEESASETEIMRRALARYAQERQTDPLEKFIGIGGGPTDGARRHDRYILERPRGQ